VEEAVRSGVAVMKCSGCLTGPDPLFSSSRLRCLLLYFPPFLLPFSSILFATLLPSFLLLASLLYSRLLFSSPLFAPPLNSSLDVCHVCTHPPLLLPTRIQNTHTYEYTSQTSCSLTENTTLVTPTYQSNLLCAKPCCCML
jgi:hypothetical protein